MAIKTYIEQLESVQAAIDAIESGAQSATFNGRNVTKADLKTLYDRESQLMPKALREQSGRSGIRVRGVTPVDL